jgi:nitrate reductase NapAB chaperone NapD
MNESGQQISEREIHIGNSKGLIVVTVGTENHPATDEYLNTINESLSNLNEIINANGVVIVPHNIKIEYVKVD